MFSPFVLADLTPQEQLTADCKKINNYTNKADALYKSKQYVKARENYEMQAALSEACQLDEGKISTAYNNVALTYVHTNEFLKASAWLNINHDDKKSIYNLDKFKDEIVKAEGISKNKVTGTYWKYSGSSAWSEMKVTKAKNEKYNIAYNGIYAGFLALYGGVNLGEFFTILDVKNNEASYIMDPDNDGNCSYKFTFRNNRVFVDRTAGDIDECGFGHNVTAEGTYYKVQE